MSGGAALRAAWEAAQKPAGGLRAAFDASQPKPTGIHAEYASGNLAKRMARENANDADALDAESPSYTEQALGGIASLARDIPGAEAAQAGVRALTRGQSYTDALGDIRGAEDSAPSIETPKYLPNINARTINRIIGGTVAAAALPKVIGGRVISPAMQAATMGGLSGALQATPMSLKDRAIDTGVGAAVGGTVGKVADAGTNAVRSLVAPSLGKQFIARKAAMGAADAANYGAAEAEAAAAGGTSPAIQKALAEPDIAPYVKAVRESRTLSGSDDATVLREAYKMMSDRQGVLSRAMNVTDDVKNGTRLGNADIGAAKNALLTAAEAPTPLGRPIVETAQSPKPSLRDALKNFQDRQTAAYTRSAGTTEQQMARRALERHQTADALTPITGEPPEEIAPGVMPSLRQANQVHAEFMGQQDAQTAGSKAAKSVMAGKQPGDKNLGARSTEGFLSGIPGMSPEEADAALGGVLGRGQDAAHLSPNPFTLFGVAPAAAKTAKLTPLLQALEQQRGGAPIPVDLLRAFIAGEGHPTP